MPVSDPNGKFFVRNYATLGYTQEETAIEAARQTDKETTADGYSAAANSLIAMYELDASSLGGGVFRWHPGVSQGGNALVWAGNTYVSMPIECTGFEMDGSGKLARPTMRVSNIGGIIGQYARTYGDFIGAKITRIRTLGRFIDAVNFSGGSNPTADPTQKFPDDVYYVERKTAETYDTIEWELSSILDLSGVQLPVRLVVPNVCMWAYKSARCGYSGAIATCDKGLDTPNGCKVHFGSTATLPFGGFPGCGRCR